jgi:hypothetical protein
MQTATISVVYHSNKSHTGQQAAFMAYHLQSPPTAMQLVNSGEAKVNFDALHSLAAIVFGCPAPFGNVSAASNDFTEATGCSNGEQTDGQNGLASYIELITQCDNGAVGGPLYKGGPLTAELFAQHIVEPTLHFKTKNHNS